MGNNKLWLWLLWWWPLVGFGQGYRSTNNFFFSPVMQVAQFQGRPYRCHLSLRTEPADTTAHLRFWVQQIGKNDYDFRQRNYPLDKTLASGWHTYTIEGQVQPEVKKLWLYLVLTGNGTFSFDNITLEVQRPDQSWQPVAVANGDFERPGPPLAHFQTSSPQLPPGVATELVPGASADHSQALRITMTGGQLVKNSPPYGRNPAAGHYCQLPRTRLYYETYGRGEPLLLLHGNGESIRSFAKQIAPLAEHFRVIAVDTRGQGRSLDSLTTRFTYELFADDMKALLDSLHLPKAHILGWSDGGITGLLLAERYPARVEKLVVMGANLFPTSEAVEARMLKQTEQARRVLARQGNWRNERLLTLVLTEPHLSYDGLTAIKAPVLVLAGEHDIIKPAHTQAIGAHIPQAQVVFLKGTTHYAPQENPALFNETVLRFLEAK